jgi:hypothetical protein
VSDERDARALTHIPRVHQLPVLKAVVEAELAALRRDA